MAATRGNCCCSRPFFSSPLAGAAFLVDDAIVFWEWQELMIGHHCRDNVISMLLFPESECMDQALFAYVLIPCRTLPREGGVGAGRANVVDRCISIVKTCRRHWRSNRPFVPFHEESILMCHSRSHSSMYSE
jgi:hypothetical protein